MYLGLDREGTIEGLHNLLKQTAADKNIAGTLVLACKANAFTPGKVDRFLKQCKKPVFGGIFPQILFGQKKLQKGTIVAGLRQTVSAAAIKNIDSKNKLEAILEDMFVWQALQDKTMFVFIDGRSSHISTLVESIFNCFGLFPNYIGGGAGSFTDKEPCVFSNKGLLKDAAVIALADIKSGIGVAHGWEPVAGPLKVTATDDDTIISLNWRPAFEVYREIVEEVSGKLFLDVGFSQLAKGFPFGIIKMAKEMVVRDPIALEGDRLVCVGGVPLNSFVYVLKGDRQSLIAGAAKARQLAAISYRQETGSKEEAPFTTIFMDCISRALFLQSDFVQELMVVSRGYPLIGALTLGEIANSGRNYLEFYNYTAVIGLLED
ncbi:MAG: FIST signal transduction protein [Dethiobacteria bacterium]|jgi:hypothetical protein